jgi:type VI secretion system secreted protein VgrG
MNYTQEKRLIGISTPLGDDVLLLRSMQGREGISRIFRFELELLSENGSISFDDLIGKNATVRIMLPDGDQRYWNGHIVRFSQGGSDHRLAAYHAVMAPWLWFLTRTADCRIFQNQTAPDIIRRIFQDLGFHDFELRLTRTFPEREYCVQYRETDFNFVSRLMEEEGIFYFFEHSKNKHTLILADDFNAHKPCPAQDSARCQLTGGSTLEDDVVTEWEMVREFRPDSYTITDYNFETPSASLLASVKGKGGYEIYDYPGIYLKRSDGERLVRIRHEEQQTPVTVTRGSGNCRSFAAGYRFNLKDHYRGEMNAPWVLTAVDHMATQGIDYATGDSTEAELTYTNNFECIPHGIPFRPSRLTPKPVVQGCQTAVTVGPGGEEIYTDKYGRVKVQFHWDREGKQNENSSCWIRVSQPWAGKGFGGLAIPRIGQEVVVDFLEGDPDRPIIIGRVYNASQMPPFGLPAGAVISGVKSNSTKGGGGDNEISLNDTKGNELINIHGQYDMQTRVEHDERVTIGNNRTENVGVDESITIGNNRTEKVGANETIAIVANRTENVGVNETITIGSNRTETVGASESITVALMRTRNVGINEMVNIGLAQEVNVGALQMISVGAARILNVGLAQRTTIGTSLKEVVGTNRTEEIGGHQKVQIGSDLHEKIGSSQTVKIGAKLTETIGGDHKNQVGGDRHTKIASKDTLDVGSHLTIKAGRQITLETGASKIVMKAGGKIEISGSSIEINGTMAVKAKAVTVDIKASGVNTIKGSLVKIN